MRSRRRAAVPAELVREIDAASAALDTAQSELARLPEDQRTLVERRAAHAQLRRAFDAADVLLREATSRAKSHSYREWAHWRHRLSRLSTARQILLLSEHDDPGLLPAGCIRAVDTGMSGPALGDLLHGRSKTPGTPATYGSDLEAILVAGPTRVPLLGAPVEERPAEPVEPPAPVAVVTRSTPPAAAPSAAA